jgi:hypothetical protein
MQVYTACFPAIQQAQAWEGMIPALLDLLLACFAPLLIRTLAPPAASLGLHLPTRLQALFSI